jgi:putative sigma-54 modulation protein
VQTTLHARHLELDDRLRSRIERKLQRLDRVADPPAHATVELTAKASRAAGAAHVAVITLVTRAATIRSTSAAATPMAAVDEVLDKLERQLVQAKERVRGSRRLPAGATSPEDGASPAGVSPAAATGNPDVVEITRLDMVPMFPEDAISRMEELDHAFFVFLHAKTNRVSVVYRRGDGGYGLIDPRVRR